MSGLPYVLSLPREITWNVFFPLEGKCSIMCAMFMSRESIRDSAPEIFTGDWSHRYPLPSTNQDSCLPEGKQEFGISRIVYTNMLGTLSYSHLLTGDGTLWQQPRFQMPDKVQPCRQAFLRIAFSRLLG